MKMFRILRLFAFLFIIFPGVKYSENATVNPLSNKPPGPLSIYQVPETAVPVRVDGVLDDPAWGRALIMELSYEIDPGENLPAPVRTQCLLTYDRKNLYVAFRAYDPEPTNIQAHYMDRDMAWDDDWIFITLDPFSDQRRGFQFIANPLGVQMDSLLNEVGGRGAEVDSTWDAIWDSAGRLTDDGYIVEMAIPFTSIRFPRGKGDQKWGFQAMRHYPRSFYYFFRLTPWNRNRGCTLCENVIISGFSSITPGLNLEVNPTITTLRTDKKDTFPEGDLHMGKVKIEPGLSTRWSVTPNISLNAALNPDFSHVEADVAQLEINTRFALYYPEKRPFFLEAADIFNTAFNTVYTRTIADPIWGLKLTAKEQRNAFGVIISRDDVTNLLVPANQESQLLNLDQSVNNTIARYRRDIGKHSTLGVLLTDRRGNDYSNTVFGLDGYFKITAVDNLGLQFLYSKTTYPASFSRDQNQPEGSFGGLGLNITYLHEARNWNWWALYEHLGRDFRADAGFIPRVDTRTIKAGVRRIFWPKSASWFSRINLSIEGISIHDQKGNLTDRSISFIAEINGPLQSNLTIGASIGEELFNNILFDQKSIQLQFNIRPGSPLTLSLGGKFGDAIDYTESRAADILGIAPGIAYFFGRHLQLRLDHSLEYLNIDGERLYKANLTQLKFVWQFNVRTFIRAIIQYLDINKNLDLYPRESNSRDRHLFMQLLFSYKINPQTLLFFGYADNRFGRHGIDLTQKDRTFFCKISYAWRQ